jgi:hypothetical protein
MIKEPVTWVKAAQDYFSSDPHARKIEISEFKALTDADRDDMAAMLREVGYTITDR